MLRHWSKFLEPFYSQNGQISSQSCSRIILCGVLEKLDTTLNTFAIYRAIIYVFMYIINFSVVVKAWPWLSQYQQRTESGGSGAWRGTRQFSPVLYTSSAQAGFIQIILKEESVRKLKWMKSKIKPEENDVFHWNEFSFSKYQISCLKHDKMTWQIHRLFFFNFACITLIFSILMRLKASVDEFLEFPKDRFITIHSENNLWTYS